MRKTISAREVQVSVLHWDIWSLTMPCYNSTELLFESSNCRKNNKWDFWSNTGWTYWQRLPGSSKVWAWLAESSLRIWGQLEFSYSATLRHFFQDFIPINFQVIFDRFYSLVFLNISGIKSKVSKKLSNNKKSIICKDFYNCTKDLTFERAQILDFSRSFLKRVNFQSNLML